MFSPLETGTAPEATPGRGRSRETWASRGFLALAGGARHRERQATGGLSAAKPGKVPCISYMEGTLSYSARHKRLGQERHAGKHSVSGRRHPWASHRKNRAGTDPGHAPADQDPRPDQGFTPAQD